jgi:hypothetical protein
MSILANLLIHFFDVFGLQGRVADNKCVENDTDGPGVNFKAVGAVKVELQPLQI